MPLILPSALPHACSSPLVSNSFLQRAHGLHVLQYCFLLHHLFASVLTSLHPVWQNVFPRFGNPFPSCFIFKAAFPSPCDFFKIFLRPAPYRCSQLIQCVRPAVFHAACQLCQILFKVEFVKHILYVRYSFHSCLDPFSSVLYTNKLTISVELIIYRLLYS